MSALETSVTLEDVFVVVMARRVPLAPELAGYLSLEVADGADPGGGEVDPRTVYISEEGTVALVRPKKDHPTGDAEASVRGILTKLLEASGSSTPALSAAARRKPVAGLPALVEELEAALIPVNRAAGRRALARLARETKRVTMGVGRNASVPPPTGNRAEPDAPASAAPRSRGSFDSEAVTAKRAPVAEAAAMLAAPEIVGLAPAGVPRPAPGTVPPRGAPVPLPPPPGKPGSVAPAAPKPPRRVEAKLLSGDEVDSLLDSFATSGASSDKQMSRDLKAIAGLDPTPAPPNATTLAELTKDVGKDLPKSRPAEADSVEALLALADVSGPLAAPLPPAGFPAKPTSERPPQPPAILVAPLAPIPGVAPLPGSVPIPAMAAEPEPVASPEPPSEAPVSPLVPSDLMPSRRAENPVGVATRIGGFTGRREKVVEVVSSPPSARRTGARTGAQTQRRPRAPRTGMVMLLFALVVVVGSALAIWKMNPAFFTGRRHTSASTSTATTAPTPPPSRCKVALVVQDVPANAEILLRVGQSPLDVERMPVGTRLEFVATAEGYTPRRAVMKAEAPWDKGPDGKPRTDLPVQLDPSKAKPGQLDPWPVAEPGSQVGGSGAPGTVHVVANVRGVEIWLLAGLGPEARIEQLKCEGDIDVLLAGPPGLRKRLHVGEKEIAAAAADAQGNKVVSVSAK